MLVGVVAGLISGIFFSVYSDLRPQIENIYCLLGASLLVTTIWYLIIVAVSFLLFCVITREK